MASSTQLSSLEVLSKLSAPGRKLCGDAPPPASPYSIGKVELTKDRVIFLTEDVSKQVSDAISALLLYYSAIDDEKEIRIYIDTNGGDSDALVNMIDMINHIKAPVRTVCLSKAYSAGALLLAAGTPGRRCALKNSSIMIHGLQCLFPQFGEMDIVKSAHYYKYLESHNNTILGLLAEKTGQEVAQVKEDCKKDLFLSPKEALEYGIIDSVVNNLSDIF
jgi:ATP-dependent Clp protease protease subunit